MLTYGNYHHVAFKKNHFLCEASASAYVNQKVSGWNWKVLVYFYYQFMFILSKSLWLLTSSLPPEGYHLSLGCLMPYSLIKLIP